MNNLITDVPDGPQFPHQILRQLILNRKGHFNEAATFGMKGFSQHGLKVGIAAIDVLVRGHESVPAFGIEGLSFLVEIAFNATEFKLTQHQGNASVDGRMVDAVAVDKLFDYGAQCEGRQWPVWDVRDG